MKNEENKFNGVRTEELLNQLYELGFACGNRPDHDDGKIYHEKVVEIKEEIMRRMNIMKDSLRPDA